MKKREGTNEWLPLVGKPGGDTEQDFGEDRDLRHAIFKWETHTTLREARLLLGDKKHTEILFDTDPDVRAYCNQASKVLEAKLGLCLGTAWNDKPFKYVKRAFAEIDSEGNIEREHGQNEDLVNFILSHKSRTFVLCSASGGVGKSTMLLKIAEQIVKRSAAPDDVAFGKAPIYIESHWLGGDWMDSLVKELGRRQESQSGALEAYLSTFEVSPACARIFLEQISGSSEVAPSEHRDLMLLIDGPNEARHETFCSNLERSFDGNIKIVAVPKDCLGWFRRHPDCQRLEVFPFSVAESTEFCEHVGETLPERLPGARDIEHVPLALRLWCQLSKERREGIRTSYELYDAIVEKERAWEKDKWEDVQERPGSKAPAVRVDELFEILAAIAYEALGRGRTRVIDRRTLADIIDSDGVRQAAGSRYSAADIHKALEGYRTFIARIGDAGQLESYHEQFCHFLAAKHIVETMKPRDPQDYARVCRWLQRPSCAHAASFLGTAMSASAALSSLCNAFDQFRQEEGETVDEVNKAILWDLEVWGRLLQDVQPEHATDCIMSLLSHVRPFLAEGAPARFLAERVLSSFEHLPRSDALDDAFRDFLSGDVAARLEPAGWKDPDFAQHYWHAVYCCIHKVSHAMGMKAEDAWAELHKSAKENTPSEVADAFRAMFAGLGQGAEATTMLSYPYKRIVRQLLRKFSDVAVECLQKPWSAKAATAVADMIRIVAKDAPMAVHTALQSALQSALRPDYPFPEVADKAQKAVERLETSTKGKHREHRLIGDDPERWAAFVKQAIKTAAGPDDPVLEKILPETQADRAHIETIIKTLAENPLDERLDRTKPEASLSDGLLGEVIRYFDSDNEGVSTAAEAWLAGLVDIWPRDLPLKHRMDIYRRLRERLLDRITGGSADERSNALKCVSILVPYSDNEMKEAVVAAFNADPESAMEAAMALDLTKSVPAVRDRLVESLREHVRFGSSLGDCILSKRTYGRLASSLGLVEELAGKALEPLGMEDRRFRIGILLMVLDELRPHLGR